MTRTSPADGATFARFCSATHPVAEPRTTLRPEHGMTMTVHRRG